MPTVTKENLVEIVITDLGCSKGQANEMVDAFFRAMVDAIAQGNKIEIRGFGSWTVRRQNAYPNARNPMTGERVSVPARRKVSFKPGKAIKEVLGRPVVESE